MSWKLSSPTRPLTILPTTIMYLFLRCIIDRHGCCFHHFTLLHARTFISTTFCGHCCDGNTTDTFIWKQWVSIKSVINVINDISSVLSMSLRSFRAVILNRGAVAHKGTPDDFQRGLNLKLDKMFIEIHLKTTTNQHISYYLFLWVGGEPLNIVIEYWGAWSQKGLEPLFPRKLWKKTVFIHLITPIFPFIFKRLWIKLFYWYFIGISI